MQSHTITFNKIIKKKVIKFDKLKLSWYNIKALLHNLKMEATMKLNRISIIFSSIFFILLVVLVLNAKSELGSISNQTQGTPIFINSDTIFFAEDIELKKGIGKYKYKSENVSDAQQSWKIIGETPTAYTSFDQVTSGFNIQFGETGETPSVNDNIPFDSTAVLGRKGNRYRQKFFYYKTTKSSGHHHSRPSFGFIKAWLKKGKLKYMYVIPKANEGGLLANTDTYNDLRTTMDASNKVEEVISLYTSIRAGVETHATQGNAVVKANKKKLKCKFEKP